jgi:Spx/MgsR family transcriptional regulator
MEFFMKIYGIKTCGSVKKAIKFFKDNGIDFEYINFRQTPATKKQISNWLTKTDIKTLLNTKGTKYRTLKLKDLNLNDSQKQEWLEKENLLIKRPVIEFNNELIVGFNEEKYQDFFC